jgi:AAA ATPase domain
VRGEAGIGKTALLRYAVRQAWGFRVAQVTGMEAEMELPFAGIHQLCAPLLDQLDALPQPQQDALNVALGLASGDVPERFLVELAVLGLLSAAPEERPLLCLVEDAQWLDAASGMVLGFVARRLLAESVALVVLDRRLGHGIRPRLSVGRRADPGPARLPAKRARGSGRSGPLLPRPPVAALASVGLTARPGADRSRVAEPDYDQLRSTSRRPRMRRRPPP